MSKLPLAPSKRTLDCRFYNGATEMSRPLTTEELTAIKERYDDKGQRIEPKKLEEKLQELKR